MICPVHKVEFILKPAGVSKRTGQPYNAFWACPTFGCREKPVGEAKGQILNEAQSDQVAINTEKYQDDQAKRSFRIERQHSQEMAIRYLELKYKFKKPTDITKLAESIQRLTDWFMKDLG